jgi:hypothetical protein
MKAMFSIFLLTIHLFTATELSQFFKLPVLLDHYTEHQAQDKALTFTSFIYRHYFTDHSKDGHTERDNQLPFHSHEDCLTLKVSVAAPVFFQQISIQLIPIEVKTVFGFFNQNIPSAHLSTIWQPPKSA